MKRDLAREKAKLKAWEAYFAGEGPAPESSLAAPTRKQRLRAYEREWAPFIEKAAKRRRGYTERVDDLARSAGNLIRCQACGGDTSMTREGRGRSVQHTELGKMVLCRPCGVANRRVQARGSERRTRVTELRTGDLEGRNVSNVKVAGTTISGIGSPYGSKTRILGMFEEFDEVVEPGAWRVTISRPDADIISTENHDISRLLGRTVAGTLKLSETRQGLRYETSVNPDDQSAMDTLARVKRGDLRGASTWFRVVDEVWEDPSKANGYEVPLRTIRAAELYEVGPVALPAFKTTTSEASSRGR